MKGWRSDFDVTKLRKGTGPESRFIVTMPAVILPRRASRGEMSAAKDKAYESATIATSTIVRVA